MDASPLQCNLDALSPAERARHAATLKELGEKILEQKELPDGYAYRFAWESEILDVFVEWIPLERACCPFFNFQLEIVEENGPAWWRVTGREGVKEFLTQIMGSLGAGT